MDETSTTTLNETSNKAEMKETDAKRIWRQMN